MKELDTSSKADFRKPDTAPSKEKESFLFILMLVNHNHLDYSWFRDRDSSQIQEGQLIDGTREALKRNKIKNFVIEQAVAGREYHPSNEAKAEFKQLCCEGKYEMIGTEIQQEIFLSGEEVFFWNVNMGHEYWESIGGRPSKAFYQPDTFGVPRSFAKMLRHAGYDNFIYTRGHGDEIKELGAVFNLTSDDGSSVLAIPMPDGYGSVSKLGRKRTVNGKEESLKDQPELWVPTATERLRQIIERYGDRYKQTDLSHVLLGSGCDFETVDLDIARIAEQCQNQMQKDFPGIKMQFGTFEEYVQRVKETVNPAKLKSFSGELRSSAEHNVLRGIDSARIPIKQSAERAERQIYSADVLLALSFMKKKYDQTMQPMHDISSLINKMHSKKIELLPAYSHDSISCCGTDDTYPKMLALIDGAWHASNQIKRDSMANLADTKDPFSPIPRYGEMVSVVNTLGYKRKKLIELPLQQNLAHAQALMASTEEGEIPVQIVERNRERYAAVALEVEGFEAQNVLLTAVEKTPKEEEKEKTRTIENEFYAVKALSNGVVKIEDKETGKVTYANLFEDVADSGDEYNFNFVKNDQPITTQKNKAKIEIINDGDVFSEIQIDMSLSLPEELSKDRKTRSTKKVSNKIRTVVRLTKGVDRVDFTTHVNNNAKDHRLRVLFKTPNASETIRAKESYEIIERPAVPIKGGKGWCEPLPIATSHAQEMLAAGDVAIFKRGLPEYEAIAGKDGNIEEVALTLLRSVGWLSRDDLSTRKTEAGPIVPTPGAQCLGKHMFEYSLNMRGTLPNDELIRQANDFKIDMQRGPKNVDLKNVLNVAGENFVISAVAPSRDRSGIIVRAYNPNQTEGYITVDGMFQNAVQTNGREKAVSEDDARHTTLRPGEIVTIKLT